MPQVFELAVVITALAGFSMVIGGMALIYKGALALAGTDKSQALSIEWKNELRISTQAPGIAFFVVGLAFCATALYAAKPNPVEPFRITGNVASVDEPLTVIAESSPWQVTTSTDGTIDGQIFPNVTSLVIKVTAPGYKPFAKPINLGSASGREIKLTGIRLDRQTSRIIGKVENIVPAPPTLAPVDARPAFGGSP